MKKVTALMFMLFVSASMALPAFAQADAGKPPEHVARWIVLAAVARQPAGVTVRAVRIGVVDGPRDNQHVVLDASFFTPEGQGRLPGCAVDGQPPFE